MINILITNIPSPYRSKQYDLIGESLGKDFYVFYTKNNFSTTKMNWKRPRLNHQHKFLGEFNNSYLHLFLNLLNNLRRYNPDIVITAGFNFLMVTAFIYAKLFSKVHVVFTDSWLHPVNQLTFLHRLIRKAVIKRSDGFICIGKKGFNYLKEYGAKPSNIFISRLADEINYNMKFDASKEYDVIFSGQIIERKQPFFFVEVVHELSKHYPLLKVLILGTGPLENAMIEELKSYNVNFTFAGYVEPKIIKEFYRKAKILLFPTLSDPWGMVANDAMSVGLPVITTPYAGCADDLVVHGVNGFVLDLDVKVWLQTILKILENSNLYNELSNNALIQIAEFTLDKASNDFVYALSIISKEKIEAKNNIIN